MIDQLTGWQTVVLVLGMSVLAIPWLYGLAAATVRGYRWYFDLVLDLFGIDPWPEPPLKEQAAPDGGSTEDADKRGGD